MKKLIMMAVVLALAGVPALAGQKGPGNKGPRDGMMANKKEYAELSAKYKKESNTAKKTAIEKEIEAKVGADYDKNLENMNTRLSESKERISKMEAMLIEAKKPEVKQERVKKITQQIITGEKPGKGEGRRFEGKERKDRRNFDRKHFDGKGPEGKPCDKKAEPAQTEKKK